MVPGASWVYLKLLKMSVSAWCSLIWKDSHSGCHLGTGGHLSFFPFPSPACSLSCMWTVEERGDCGFQAGGGQFPAHLSQSLKELESDGLLSPEQFKAPRGYTKSTSILETIAGTLEVLRTSLVSSTIAFECFSSLNKETQKEQWNVWGFSGGPVVRTQGSHSQDPFPPCRGTKIPQATRWGQKNKKQWNIPAPRNYLFRLYFHPLIN